MRGNENLNQQNLRKENNIEKNKRNKKKQTYKEKEEIYINKITKTFQAEEKQTKRKTKGTRNKKNSELTSMQ